MRKLSIKDLSNHLSSNHLMLHISPVGLLKLTPYNVQRFSKLNLILNLIQDNGGNIAVPAYSYTYTKNKI